MRIAVGLGFDVPTVRRYIAAARRRGVHQRRGSEVLDDSLMTDLVGEVRPLAGRPHLGHAAGSCREDTNYGVQSFDLYDRPGDMAYISGTLVKHKLIPEDVAITGDGTNLTAYWANLPSCPWRAESEWAARCDRDFREPGLRYLLAAVYKRALGRPGSTLQSRAYTHDSQCCENSRNAMLAPPRLV